MKKHIIGLTLFSFIVSAAAIVYAIFNVSAIPVVSEVIVDSSPQYVPAERTHCKMRRESKVNSIEIRQAVFNTQTKQISWELATPDVDEPVELLFFLKDGEGTRFIASERINNKFSYNGVLRYSSSYDWLNKRQSPANLYVMARFESEMKNYTENFQVYGNKFQPKFDAAKATAVTVDYGK